MRAGKGFFILIILITMFNSCEKENLPPETRVGANTFGFRLDSKDWTPYVHHSTFGKRTQLMYLYYETEKRLYIEATREVRKISQHITINPSMLKIDTTGKFYLKTGTGNTFEFIDNNITYLPQDSGLLEITKLDTAANIISGTFFFKGKGSDGSERMISGGRFDFNY